MDERNSLFFIDLGADREPAYLKIYVKLFDLKEALVKIHTPEGDVLSTGLILDYFEPKRNDIEMLIEPQNSPLAPNCKSDDQLFIFSGPTNKRFQNTKAIKAIFDESTLFGAYEIIKSSLGGNVFKIVICESRYLGIPGTNKWTPYMSSREVDKKVFIQRALLGLLK